MPNSGAPFAHRIAVEAEHLLGRRVRVNVTLDMAEVSLNDRHIVSQFQATRIVRASRRNGRFRALSRVAGFPPAVVNQLVAMFERRMASAQPVDHLLLHEVRDHEDQEGHAVRVALAQAEPLGKLGSEQDPLLVVSDSLERGGP